jgi:hypothetical protein
MYITPFPSTPFFIFVNCCFFFLVNWFSSTNVLYLLYFPFLVGH